MSSNDVDEQILTTNLNRGCRLVATLLLMAAAAVGSLTAGETTPAPTVPAQPAPAVTQVETDPPSVPVGDALAKWAKRLAYARQQAGDGGSLDAATRKDLSDRLAKLDEVADGPADWTAICRAAVDAGLAPQGSSYAAALVALRAGGAGPAVVAAPVAPAPAPVAVKPAAPVAEKPAEPTKVFAPGCRARLFTLPAGTAWPPAGLAADLTPQANLRLPGIPDAKPTWVQRPGSTSLLPNRYIDNPALDGQTYTAIEVRGHYFARGDGPIAISIESNFPAFVEVADRAVTSIAWFAPVAQWVGNGPNATNMMIGPADGKVVATASGSTVAMADKKYYPVRIVVFQAWKPSFKNNIAIPWGVYGATTNETDVAGRAMEIQGLGARFKLRCTPPDAAGPEVMPLYSLEPKKVLREE